MPRTGSLLTDAERAAFTVWLRGCVDRAVASGTSKLSIADALGADSTARLNRYLASDGSAQVPTAPVLAKLAHFLGASWPEAFLRAGYFRELLGVANSLGFVAKDKSTADEEARAQLREMVIAFALNAFPRRDVRRIEPFAPDELSFDPIVAYIARDLPPSTKEEVEALTRHLHPLLSRAGDALEDASVPPVVRRAIASEYVNAWADEYDLELATRRRFLQKHVSRILEMES